MKATIKQAEPTPPPQPTILLDVSINELTYLLRSVGHESEERASQACTQERVEGSITGVSGLSLYRQLGEAYNRVTR